MQLIHPLLQKCFLGQGVETEALEALLKAPGVETVRYEKGEVIYDRTHTKRSLGLVLSGEVEVTKTQGQAGTVLMNVLGPGQCFGAASMFQEYGFYVTDIRARKRSSVLFLPQEALMQLFGQSRRAMANYLSFLTGRIFYLNRRIDAYTGGSAECRLAMYLLDNQQDGVPPKVTLPFGMNKLAELLGIGRASLYRAMETLEKKGIAAREGKCIAILKPNDLLHYDGAQGIREDGTT